MTNVQATLASQISPAETLSDTPSSGAQPDMENKARTADHSPTALDYQNINYQNFLACAQQFAQGELLSEGGAFRKELVQTVHSLFVAARGETAIAQDQTAEIEDLRRGLIEAKDTIIKLLTERVNDHAQMARLETELRFLPDLQAQADKALAVATDAGDFRDELSKLRFELNKAHLSRMRTKLHKRRRDKSSWWTKMCSHFLTQDAD